MATNSSTSTSTSTSTTVQPAVQPAVQPVVSTIASYYVRLPQAPKGWVKIAQVHNTCVANGVPITRFVAWFGGDKGYNPPLHPIFTVVLVGHTRYLNPWCNTQSAMRLMLLLHPHAVTPANLAKTGIKIPVCTPPQNIITNPQ